LVLPAYGPALASTASVPTFCEGRRTPAIIILSDKWLARALHAAGPSVSVSPFRAQPVGMATCEPPRLCNRMEPGTSCSARRVRKVSLTRDILGRRLRNGSANPGKHRHPGKTRAAGRQPVFPICRTLVSIVKMSCYPTTCRVFATYTGPQWERKRNQQYHRAHKGSDYGSRSFHTRMHREARLLAPQSPATRT